MKHYYQDIYGWFTFPRLYSDIVKNFPDGSRFVEIGSYEAKSISYLLVEMVNAKKSFDVVCIDSFTFGSEKTGENILSVFRRNLSKFEGAYKVVKDISWESAELFADNSIDACMIDADHVEASVRKDVLAFLPKMKKGGWLCGHDYCDPRWYENEHPGVAIVVHELFGDNWCKDYLDEKTWVKIIE